MAKQDITPDSLAQKSFLITFIGVVLYAAVVFVFVIGGNKDIDNNAGLTPKSFAGHSDPVYPAKAPGAHAAEGQHHD